ncbi:MAG: dihydroneopterin aldolase [Pseudomonadota bacterium]
MSRDLSLAFAHPEERARADAPERDRISVRDLVLDAEIGAFQAERGVTQRIRFNVVVEVSALPADLSDDVDRILSYDRITEAIEAALAEERLNLLETLAERVAQRILVEPQAERAFLRIEKLDRGPGTLGVEIVRSAGPKVRSIEDTPQPRIVAVGNRQISDDALSHLLDALAAEPSPLILCVGFPEAPAPEGGNAPVQRRIDLLAIEQNAWMLAGRDPRCVVVGTRTELDWGMRHGQISVWAPSKMVLDAVEGPESADAGALISWLASEMQAAEILTLGLDVAACDVPQRDGLR